MSGFRVLRRLCCGYPLVRSTDGGACSHLLLLGLRGILDVAFLGLGVASTVHVNWALCYHPRLPTANERLTNQILHYQIGPLAVDTTIKRFSKLDGLIVNHGTLSPVKRIADSTPEEWRTLFDINFFSALAFVRSHYPIQISPRELTTPTDNPLHSPSPQHPRQHPAHLIRCSHLLLQHLGPLRLLQSRAKPSRPNSLSRGTPNHLPGNPSRSCRYRDATGDTRS